MSNDPDPMEENRLKNHTFAQEVFALLVFLLVCVQVQFTVWLFIFGVHLWNILPVIVVPVILLTLWWWTQMRVTVNPREIDDPACVIIDRE